MTDEKLIAHAQRLHGLACGQGASRHDLIQLRDLVPMLIERLSAKVESDDDLVVAPKLESNVVSISVVK